MTTDRRITDPEIARRCALWVRDQLDASGVEHGLQANADVVANTTGFAIIQLNAAMGLLIDTAVEAIDRAARVFSLPSTRDDYTLTPRRPDLLDTVMQPAPIQIACVRCSVCGVSPVGSTCFITGTPHEGIDPT